MRGTHGLPGIELGLITYKASVLSSVLSLWLLKLILGKLHDRHQGNGHCGCMQILLTEVYSFRKVKTLLQGVGIFLVVLGGHQDSILKYLGDH